MKDGPSPAFWAEMNAWRAGYHVVAGLDEVGRGPLAGPVVAAAVVLPHPLPRALRKAGIRDSKQLSAQGRERIAPLIREYAVSVAVAYASVEEIDSINILEATRLAMCRAATQLSPRPDLLLTDAVALPHAGVPFQPIVDGDARCLSIASASIVAKVFRDALMVEMDAAYPAYGFAQHKGYGTAEHLAALARLGPTPEHRRSFAPVREIGPVLPGHCKVGRSTLTFLKP